MVKVIRLFPSPKYKEGLNINSGRVRLHVQIFLSVGAGTVMPGESCVTLVAYLGQPFVRKIRKVNAFV